MPPEKVEGEIKNDIFESSTIPANDNIDDTDTKVKTDEEKSPAILALTEQLAKLETDKKSMSENLIAQGKLIEDLRKGIHTDEDGKKSAVVEDKDIPVPYKAEDIKFSKDLTDDEKDGMTATEMKLFDELASMKVKANEKSIADFKKEQQMVEDNKKEQKVTDLNGTVRSIALSLVGNDVTKANEIIESAKRFNLEGLDGATLKTRIEDAQKLLPDYKPPKEQVKKVGDAVKVTDNSNEDPFGSSKIIEQAKNRNKGTYSL